VTAIGVMIEGQEGLTWERWRSICADAEQLGFATLRRSDHFFSVMGEHERECIDCWTSLALAAEWTSRIELGPMVTPLTFKLPAVPTKTVGDYRRDLIQNLYLQMLNARFAEIVQKPDAPFLAAGASKWRATGASISRCSRTAGRSRIWKMCSRLTRKATTRC